MSQQSDNEDLEREYALDHPKEPMQKPIKDITITLDESKVIFAQDESMKNADGLINPYAADFCNMGEAFSPTIELMYSKHASEDRMHCILFCKVSGKRWRIEIEK